MDFLNDFYQKEYLEKLGRLNEKETRALEWQICYPSAGCMLETASAKCRLSPKQYWCFEPMPKETPSMNSKENPRNV